MFSSKDEVSVLYLLFKSCKDEAKLELAVGQWLLDIDRVFDASDDNTRFEMMELFLGLFNGKIFEKSCSFSVFSYTQSCVCHSLSLLIP